MKLAIVAVCLFGAIAMATPSNLPAVEFKHELDKPNEYHVHYVTADGTIVDERGHLVPTADGDFVMIVEGASTYKGTDGKTYTTKYTSGLDGFQASGEHFPKAPEAVKAE